MTTTQQQQQTTPSSYPVKFLPLSSTIDSPFWVKYCHLKLETIQLSEAPLPLVASLITNGRLQCQESSLTYSSNNSHNDAIACQGELLGFNTMEAFSQKDKNQLLKDVFLPAFEKGDTAALTRFHLCTFGDLKNHKVVYWFAFPALMTQTPIEATCHLDPATALSEWYPQLNESFHKFRLKCLEDTTGLPPFFVFSGNSALEPLSEKVLDVLNVPVESVVFGFVDGSETTNAADSKPPMGWALRNLIAYLSIHLHLGGKQVTIVSYRPRGLRRITAESEYNVEMEPHNSLVLNVTLPTQESYLYEGNYKVVGWELNARLKPGPRSVNLRPLLDSNHLAIQAADLNLKLMKWRMIPNLNVDMLRETKVLLLGAGTLGCSVARTLLGWGIRKFTILDYGTVSYSNPVRQNLFTLEDCHFNNGTGKPKAEAAVESLKAIAADVEAEAIHLSIPMPGHEESKEALQKSVEKLDRLIQDCDVVYLLTDTRESRWLPTIMATAHDKLLINAALGLDSWLVMRHGGGCVPDPVTPRLGCYFCNDIVAPENSTKNRTLDQQCTVTRPGLAPIASSMAVELMVSVLHHPRAHRADAPRQSTTAFSPTVDENADSTSPLGVMPHQIRGSLVSYTMMTPTVPAFFCCTGCSPATMEAYREDKVELVHQVCQSRDGSYLEKLCGLTAFRAEAAEKMENMEDWDDDEIDDM